MKQPKIKQFEIWTASLDPSFGTEPGKLRPVVIVQSDIINDAGHSSTIVCAISSQQRKDFSIMRLPVNASEETGLLKTSYILVDQIRAIDLLRIRDRVGRLDSQTIVNIKNSIKAILSI